MSTTQNLSNSPPPSSIDAHFVNSIVRAAIDKSRPEKSKSAPKRKLVGNSGACLTSDEAVAHLRADSDAKRQKLDDAAAKKRMAEQKRMEKERDMEARRVGQSQRKADRLEEESKNKKLKLVKKQNKARRVCECNKKMADDDRDEQKLWLNCFDCNTWCCLDCTPNEFKSKTNIVYVCIECGIRNEE